MHRVLSRVASGRPGTSIGRRPAGPSRPTGYTPAFEQLHGARRHRLSGSVVPDRLASKALSLRMDQQAAASVDDHGAGPAAGDRVAAQTNPVPTVAILMCTFNGERYLDAQMASFEAQRHQQWTLHVSDDGSTDRTLDLVEAFARRVGPERVRVRAGARRGSSTNFLSLACDPSIDADFYAFADQDDVWHADRLSRSIEWLAREPAEAPALYCGRTRYVDASGRPIGMSPNFRRSPAFENALVQSLAGGNTMTWNRAVHALLVRAGDVPVVVHDWWLYLLVSGCGGRVRYDPSPAIDYRQHGGNQIGSAAGVRARLGRLRAAIGGRIAQWNEVNDRALARIEPMLSAEARRVLAAFRSARRGGLVSRLRHLADSGVWRQTAAGTFSLWAGALANRL